MDNQEINTLIHDLGSEDWQVSRQASQRLMQIGPPAVPALLGVLDGNDIASMVSAVSALEVINDQRAIDPLVRLMLRNIPELAQPLVFALGRFGAASVRAVASILVDDSQPLEVRVQAASALARTDSPDAIQALQNSLDDPLERIQKIAANSLGWIRHPETLNGVSAALEHESVDVRYEVTQGLEWRAYYLEQIPPGSDIEAWLEVVTVPMLLVALDDANVDVRASAAAGLGWAYNDEAVDALVERLQDDSPMVRHNAAASLGEIAQPDTVQPLIAALEAGNEEAAIALDVIATLHAGTPYADQAQAALDDFNRSQDA